MTVSVYSIRSDVPHGAPGEIIVKYGMPIGVATEAIAPGEHVHVHNIKSNYTPTYHLADRDGDEAA